MIQQLNVRGKVRNTMERLCAYTYLDHQVLLLSLLCRLLLLLLLPLLRIRMRAREEREDLAFGELAKVSSQRPCKLVALMASLNQVDFPSSTNVSISSHHPRYFNCLLLREKELF